MTEKLCHDSMQSKKSKKHAQHQQLSTTEAVKLSPRECQVVGLLAQEFNDKQVASALGISESSVRQYIARAQLKIGRRTRIGAVVWWVVNGRASRFQQHDARGKSDKLRS